MVILVVVILFLGSVYMISQKSGVGFVSYILTCITAITIPYWVVLIKNMLKNKKSKYVANELDTKNWVYDLIKDNNEIVFVAEVPGPEDKITVRLLSAILYIKSTNTFSKTISIEGSNNMKIQDFKYRNGVLTLRIKS